MDYVNVQIDSNKNSINFSSIFQCGHDNTGSSSIFHQYGSQTLISTNITKTRCQKWVGYSFHYSPVKINFCCFKSNDNHESNYVCMKHMQTKDSNIKKSIFKNNSCETNISNWGLLYSDSSNIIVSECIFIKNKANHTFGAGTQGILTVINCTGDDLSANSYDGTINTNKMMTNSFNLKLSLLSLGKCEAEFPFILYKSNTKQNIIPFNIFKWYYFWNFIISIIFNFNVTGISFEVLIKLANSLYHFAGSFQFIFYLKNLNLTLKKVEKVGKI